MTSYANRNSWYYPNNTSKNNTTASESIYCILIFEVIETPRNFGQIWSFYWHNKVTLLQRKSIDGFSEEDQEISEIRLRLKNLSGF